MPTDDGERFGRIEQKLNDISGDVTEIKQGMRETTNDLREAVLDFTTTIAGLHKDFVSREDGAKMERRIDSLEGRVRKMENWRNWLTGAYVVIIGIFVMLFEYGKQWFSGGGHP